METQDNTKNTIDRLPDDPLKMPPPYWRESSAGFHVLYSLKACISNLPLLKPVLERTDAEAKDWFRRQSSRYNGQEAGESFETMVDEGVAELMEILTRLSDLEVIIQVSAESAILMLAIEAEDNINEFCVYNLHQGIAETIEKLSPPEKLQIASLVVGKDDVKGNAAFEAIKQLSKWRNAFAHGHRTDRSTKSLRQNHLIHPTRDPMMRDPLIPEIIQELKEMADGYVRIAKYLQSISLNPYTAERRKGDISDIEGLLKELSHFHFKFIDEQSVSYALDYDETDG